MKKNRYQIEYESTTNCFWETKPGKYVKLFVEEIKNDLNGLKVLDIGAGEGKNSVYLASNGANVISIDVSSIALSRFNLQPNYEKCYKNITRIEADIRSVKFLEDQFDIIISYGLFHALENINEVYHLFNESIKWLKNDGYYIIVTFTDEIPPPLIQNYLEYDSFINYNSFMEYIKKFNILANERDIITETHPTSQIEHNHSLLRIIIQKICN
jgi:tellurite methyltransferase